MAGNSNKLLTQISRGVILQEKGKLHNVHVALNVQYISVLCAAVDGQMWIKDIIFYVVSLTSPAHFA